MPDEPDDEPDDKDGKDEGAPSKSGSRRGPAAKQKTEETEKRGTEHEDAIARVTSVGLHLAEDFIYTLTALILLAGAVVVLGVSVYHLASDATHGIKDAIEEMLDSLLIVFILVELLSAVRAAIDEHRLVAEPFLLVGVLAAIKEIVVLATFRIEGEKPSDIALKIGTLGGIVVGLAVATLVLRRREREPRESGD